MGLTEDLLIILTNYSGGYKLIRKRLITGNDFHCRENSNHHQSEIKDQSVRTTLTRLKNKGLIKNTNGDWKITGNGRIFIEERQITRNKHFKTNLKQNKKDLIIIFDIPERLKKKRDWLRKELISLGFKIVQKSVWLGPSPLPREFMEHLSQIGLISCLRFFKVREDDLV